MKIMMLFAVAVLTTAGLSAADAAPGVTLAVDRPEVDTGLAATEVITLTATSDGSFSGNVSVTASLVDGVGNPLTVGGLTVMGPPTITVPLGGSASASYAVTIPSDATATGISAVLKLDVSTPTGGTSSTSLLVVSPTLTFVYQPGLGLNIFAHPTTQHQFSVKQGAQILLRNDDTTPHSTRGAGGFPNEPITGGQPGNTFSIDTSPIPAGTTGAIGCHTHGSITNAAVTVVN